MCVIPPPLLPSFPPPPSPLLPILPSSPFSPPALLPFSPPSLLPLLPSSPLPLLPLLPLLPSSPLPLLPSSLAALTDKTHCVFSPRFSPQGDKLVRASTSTNTYLIFSFPLCFPQFLPTPTACPGVLRVSGSRPPPLLLCPQDGLCYIVSLPL